MHGIADASWQWVEKPIIGLERLFNYAAPEGGPIIHLALMEDEDRHDDRNLGKFAHAITVDNFTFEPTAKKYTQKLA